MYICPVHIFFGYIYIYKASRRDEGGEAGDGPAGDAAAAGPEGDAAAAGEVLPVYDDHDGDTTGVW